MIKQFFLSYFQEMWIRIILLLWILFYSDGLTSTYEISKKTKYNQKEIEKISENLKKLKLLSINE